MSTLQKATRRPSPVPRVAPDPHERPKPGRHRVEHAHPGAPSGALILATALGDAEARQRIARRRRDQGLESLTERITRVNAERRAS